MDPSTQSILHPLALGQVIGVASTPFKNGSFGGQPVGAYTARVPWERSHRHRRGGPGLAAWAGPWPSGDRWEDRLPAVSGQGEAGNLSHPVRRALTHRSVRLQAGPASVARQGTAAVGAHGPTVDDDDRQAKAGDPADGVHVQPARAERRLAQRTAARHWRGRRRDLFHQVDAHRGDQPLARHDAVHDRQPDSWPTEHGRLAQLRPWQRVAGTARLRGDDVARPARHLRAVAVRLLLRLRFFAVTVAGGQVPHRWRAGVVPVQPEGRQPRGAARPARRPGQAQRDEVSRGR